MFLFFLVKNIGVICMWDGYDIFPPLPNHNFVPTTFWKPLKKLLVEPKHNTQKKHLQFSGEWTYSFQPGFQKGFFPINFPH